MWRRTAHPSYFHTITLCQPVSLTPLSGAVGAGGSLESFCETTHISCLQPTVLSVFMSHPPPLLLPTVSISPSPLTHAGHPPSPSPFPITTLPASLVSQAGPPSLCYYCNQDGCSCHPVRQDRGCWHRRHRRSQAGIRRCVDRRAHGSAERNPRSQGAVCAAIPGADMSVGAQLSTSS